MKAKAVFVVVARRATALECTSLTRTEPRGRDAESGRDDPRAGSERTFGAQVGEGVRQRLPR